MKRDRLAWVLALWTTATGAWANESAPAASAVCGPITLVDVAPELGLDFRHEKGDSGAMHLPESMGGGLAWLDSDGDGWWDLYLVQSGPFPPDGSEAASNRLYRNLAGGAFQEVAGQRGGRDRGCGQGAVAADVDGDDDMDLYVTNFGPDVLLLNQGDGSFVDATAAAGLGLDGWSSSGALADADGDGDLDLYVSRYMEYDPEHGLFCGDPETGVRWYCDPSLFLGAGDRFYRNLGGGRFEDVTTEAGVAPADGRGLGVVFVDFDGDAYPDIYVANDLNINLMFHNRGDGTFEDVALLSGSGVNREGKPEAGMGVAVGDIDGDLDPDLAVTNFDVETNTLYANQGELLFIDISASAGFAVPSFNHLAFGLTLSDLDRDGDLDFFIVNGHIFEHPRRENVFFAQPDQLLLGDGRGGFQEADCPFLRNRSTVSRGLAVADYDNDGDLDLAIQISDGPVALLRNGVESGHWLGIRLRGLRPNTEAVGARVVLITSAGRQQVRWVLAGDAYQSSSDRRLLFGFPSQEEPASLEVSWPSGGQLRLVAPPANRYLTLFEAP